MARAGHQCRHTHADGDDADPPVAELEEVLGDDAPFPPVRTLPVAAAVLVLTLYPYVYLLARVAFRDQAATPYGAARTLGLRPLQAARRVVLPLARLSEADRAYVSKIEAATTKPVKNP